MHILALDISGSVTGWCHGLHDAARPVSGTVSWRRHKDESEDDVLRHAGIWLGQMIATTGAQQVAFEAPIKRSGGGFTNAASQSMLLTLQGGLRFVVVYQTGRPAALVPSSTVRKTFIGKGGNFDGDVKLLVQQECLRRGFIDPDQVQGDRCDAIALWTHMAAKQLPSLAFHPPKPPRAAKES